MRNSNTYLNGRRSHIRFWASLLAAFSAFILCTTISVSALDPDRAISQYKRDFWGIEQGFTGGTVYAFAQTPDGYLWIGTEQGLIRFDGLNFQLINQPNFSQRSIVNVIADADGNLWLRTGYGRIRRYSEGKFEDVTVDSNQPVWGGISQTKDRRALLLTYQNQLVKDNGIGFQVLASEPEFPKMTAISMAQTSDGNIWIGTRDNGLIRFSDEKFSFLEKGLPNPKINCLLPDGDQKLWIGTDKGLVFWNGEELIKTGIPAYLNNAQILTMVKDHDGNIWIGTNNTGLVRVNESSGTAAFMKKNEADETRAVTTLFEDREGNIWAGNDEGIERFRDSAFVTYTTVEGLPSEKNGPVFVDTQNRIWFAPSDGGLYWLKDGLIEKIIADGLANDVVYSITGDSNNLWIGRQKGGLTRIRLNQGAFTTETYTEREGLAQNSVSSVYESRDGSIWAGTISAGVSRLKDGEFTTYYTANGLAANSVTAIAESVDGRTMWFATPQGLSALSNGNWRTYKKEDGFPTGNLMSLLLDTASGNLLIGSSEGLAYLDSSGRFHSAPENVANLRETVTGMAEDRNGSLWVSTSNHVFSVSLEQLLQGTITETDIRQYGLADGLKSVGGVNRSRTVQADNAGRIWFSLKRGISMVDPERLKNTSAPAIVQVQGISVDNKPLESKENVSISSASLTLSISYTGLSLSNPERVKFRFRLDGVDNGWREPTSERLAVYTNLTPGDYTFRVIASNSDGVWNSDEAILRFKVEPMFWQTLWFQFLSVIVVALIIMALYRLRMHRLTGRLNARFEERLAERTRIAQQLHDSLLQGFVSVSMQLNVAVDNLPDESPPKRQLNRILELMNQVMDEGRNTLRGLRSSSVNSSDGLEKSLAEIPHTFGLRKAAYFSVIIEGTPRSLLPIIREETYHIGCEAVLNAFRHSKANKIEVIIEYTPKYLKLSVSDDGHGIDPHILEVGREGHWGLIGMRERAQKINSQLKVWSRPGAGTKIELIVPDYVAFQKDGFIIEHPFKWFLKSSLLRRLKQNLKEEQGK